MCLELSVAWIIFIEELKIDYSVVKICSHFVDLQVKYMSNLAEEVMPSLPIIYTNTLVILG